MDRADFRAMFANPTVFRAKLLIDTDTGVQPLESVMDPWQRADFEALDVGWQRAIGRTVEGGHSRAYLERPRGHSKTADIAIMGCWAVLAAQRRIHGVAAAGDHDQARLIRDAVRRLVDCNRWLAMEVPDCDNKQKRPLIDVQSYVVRNAATGSTLEIISSDVSSSYGQLADFVVLDELPHWVEPRGEKLWHSLFTTVGKRQTCLLVIIANAGHGRGSSWQWHIREQWRQDPACYFHSLDGPQASWVTEVQLEEQRRLLPAFVYRQYWDNQWVAEAGGALSEEDIRACIVLGGPADGPEPGFSYGLGLDLAETRDHAALVLLGVDHKHHQVKLCHLWNFPPPVKIEDVYQQIIAVRDGTVHSTTTLQGGSRKVERNRDGYPVNYIAVDLWQAQHLAERLEADGFVVDRQKPVGDLLNSQVSVLLQCFKERSIDLYDHPLLIGDLMKASIVPRSYGYRITSPRDDTGHGDRLSALLTILPIAMEGAMELEEEEPFDDGIGEQLLPAAMYAA